MVVVIRLKRQGKISSLTFISLASQIKLLLSAACTMMLVEQSGTVRFEAVPQGSYMMSLEILFLPHGLWGEFCRDKEVAHVVATVARHK